MYQSSFQFIYSLSKDQYLNTEAFIDKVRDTFETQWSAKQKL